MQDFLNLGESHPDLLNLKFNTWPYTLGMLISIVPPMGIILTEAALVKITAIFNNLAYNTHLRTSWGFSCLVETAGHTILFDAGGDGEVLLSNMRHLAIDPTPVSRTLQFPLFFSLV